MNEITVEETEAFIYVTVTGAVRNPGHKAAAAARKIADGKILRISSGGSYLDGVQTLTYTYSRGPAKADLAAEKARKAEVKYYAAVRAEYDREWEKIDAAEAKGCIASTAWNYMVGGEENADLTAEEEGFERRSDRWCEIALSSYNSLMDELQPEHRPLAYTRNIDDDIVNGVIEEL